MIFVNRSCDVSDRLLIPPHNIIDVLLHVTEKWE